MTATFGHSVEAATARGAVAPELAVWNPRRGGWEDMHALKQHAQEVVQRHDEGVGPLSREVRGEGGVGVWGRQEGQDKPILPLGLVLELCGLLYKELLGLVISVCLRRQRGGSKTGEETEVRKKDSSLAFGHQPAR